MIQDNIEAIYKALHSDLSKEPFDIDVGDVSRAGPEGEGPQDLVRRATASHGGVLQGLRGHW